MVPEAKPIENIATHFVWLLVILV